MGKLWLAGRWVEGAETSEVRAPWDGTSIGTAPHAGAGQIEEAIAVAERASSPVGSLGQWPAFRRRDVLTSIASALAARRESLATLIAREVGKPITLARGEVDRAVRTFSLGAEESLRLGGEALCLEHGPGQEGTTGAWFRVPAGPVLAISPFNFPLNLVAHKLAPAFALGAPVLLKPAPRGVMVALELARIVEEAGAPAELLSVLPTSNELAERMVRDDRLAVLTFTGSARVGWDLKARCGRKRCLLELGGNAAAIVAPDADLEHALDRIVPAGYQYAGQVCIKAQRVFVHRSVAGTFTDRLVERVRAIPIGDPMDPATVCGPVIDEASGARLGRWLTEAVERGAEVLVGGRVEKNRVTPAVVVKAGQGMALVDEEVFGPVVTVHVYDSLDEVWTAVDGGRYGLQAGLFTHDMRIAREAFRRLRVGALIVGDAPSFRADAMPYGGVKDSGLGREGVRYAIDEMSEKRLLVFRG